MCAKVKQMSDQIRSKMYVSRRLPPKFHVSLNLDILPFSKKRRSIFLGCYYITSHLTIRLIHLKMTFSRVFRKLRRRGNFPMNNINTKPHIPYKTRKGTGICPLAPFPEVKAKHKRVASG